MRYEYLILPPAPESWYLRLLRAVRALFQHPGRALMIGLLLLFAATQLRAQQKPAQIEGRIALKERVRAAGYRVIIGMRPNALSRGMIAPGRSAVGDAAAQGITRNLERKGLHVRGRVSIIPAVFGEVSEASLDALLDDPNVEYVESDVAMPLAVRSFGRTARYTEDIPWGVPRVTAPEAWALGGFAAYGAGVKVAYLDSGGDYNHPDLLFAGGYDAMTGNTSPSAWADDLALCDGHGTHVAGTIAARRNNIGVVGVAPDAALYAIKVFEDVGGSCMAYQSRQIAGINWAVNNGIKVISISIAGTTINTSYQSAISSASALGVYIVASAGNDGASTLTYPGAYTDALSVGALDAENNRSGYSNYGPKLFISAPGDGILSTVPGGYGYKTGTSMAAPHVAGLVTLLLARYPGISRTQMLTRLRQGALDLGAPGLDDQYGWGLSRSRESMEGTTAPPPPPLVLVRRSTTVSNSSSADQDLAATGDSVYVEVEPGLAWSVGTTASWIELSTGSGQGPRWISWRRDFSGMGYGISQDSLVFSAGAGNDREVFLIVTETVVSGADAVAPDAAASALFGSPSMSALQRQMLDLLSNGNGRYDVGDFLAYSDRTGAIPSAMLMGKLMELGGRAAPRR